MMADKKDLAQDAKDLAQDVQKNVEDGVKNIKDKAEKALNDVPSAEELSKRAREQFLDIYDDNESKIECATSFIQDRPVLSIVASLIVGIVFGRLFFRKS